MDVLIKNMEIPKKGHFLIQISANGDVWVSNRNDEGTGIIIATAIELPPHGRLIDADALSNRLLGEGIGNLLIHRKQRLTVGDVRTIIGNAPAILEASTDKEESK